MPLADVATIIAPIRTEFRKPTLSCRSFSWDCFIRMALGAERRNVLGLVLRAALAQLGIGLAIGIPAALAGGRVLAGQLYGVKSDDPIILSLAVVILAACALLAASVPARRATRVDPIVALRFE